MQELIPPKPNAFLSQTKILFATGNKKHPGPVLLVGGFYIFAAIAGDTKVVLYKT
jgi:hypothetical protein